MLSILLWGVGIGAILSAVSYFGSAWSRVGLPLFSTTVGAGVFDSFWTIAICCGVFVLGAVLACLDSRATKGAPIGIVVVLLLYFFIKNPTVHTITNILLWGVSIVLIVLGAIPALIASFILHTSSYLVLVLLGCVFGFLLGAILYHQRYGSFSSFRRHYVGGGTATSGAYSGDYSSYRETLSFSGSGTEEDEEFEMMAYGAWLIYIEDEEGTDDITNFYQILLGNRGEFRKESSDKIYFYDGDEKLGEIKKKNSDEYEYCDANGYKIGETRKWSSSDEVEYKKNYSTVGKRKKDYNGKIEYYKQYGSKIGVIDRDYSGNIKLCDKWGTEIR